jgi:hypothetical protein
LGRESLGVGIQRHATIKARYFTNERNRLMRTLQERIKALLAAKARPNVELTNPLNVGFDKAWKEPGYEQTRNYVMTVIDADRIGELFGVLEDDHRLRLFNVLYNDQLRWLFNALGDVHRRQLFNALDDDQRRWLFGVLDDVQRRILFDALEDGQRRILFSVLNDVRRHQLFIVLDDGQRRRLFDVLDDGQKESLCTIMGF